MKKIKEIIVVEGRHDSAKLKKYFDCETIETGGSAVPESVLERIRHMQKTRGVIVFTDPDSPGNRIRQKVNRAVPGCKNAFVQKEDARTTKKVGIEHADYDTLNEALEHLMTMRDENTEEISAADFYRLGLGGQANSTELRKRLGCLLHIGYGNANTMRKRMNNLGITLEELQEMISYE